MATDLPTDIAASYPDRSPGDATHQEHHDTVHGVVNEVSAELEGRLSEAGLNAAYGLLSDANQPLRSRLGITKSTANPIFDTTDTGPDFTKILWPWLIRVDDKIAAPLGRYYLYFSTDHAQANGKIGLAYADSIEGPWTVHGEVYQDTTSGTESETPSVVWDEVNSEFILYYQQVAPAGALASQATLYATSTDGLTWTRQGIALDIPNTTQWPAPGHTGYFRPFRIGDSWVAYSLLQGTTGCRFAISYSRDGRTWELDPRPLGYGAEWLPYGRRFEWNTSNVFLWRGRWMWLGLISTFVSGTELLDSYFAVAPLSPDFRSVVAEPKKLFDVTQAWETGNFQQGHVFMDEGRLWLVYRSGDNIESPMAFGVAEVLA